MTKDVEPQAIIDSQRRRRKKGLSSGHVSPTEFLHLLFDEMPADVSLVAQSGTARV